MNEFNQQEKQHLASLKSKRQANYEQMVIKMHTIITFSLI